MKCFEKLEIKEGKTMKIYKMFMLNLLILLLMTGCGNSVSSEMIQEEYENGFKVVNLLDETSYEKNGKKMVQALEKLLNASENDCHMIEFKENILMDKKSYFRETIDEGNKNYYYVGEMKNSRPHGYGVLFKEDGISYIGEFEKGRVKDSYGMKFTWNNGIGYIEYAGEIEYLTSSRGNNLIPIMADGTQTIFHDYSSLNLAKVEEYIENFEIINDEELYVIKCMPQYIGEIKNETEHGKGVEYYSSGIVEYEGELKRGSYHGKGNLYYENGILQYSGEFKFGFYHGKGKLYDESGNLIHDGKFRLGDIK